MSKDPGPPYAFIADVFKIMPYEHVLATIEGTAREQSKQNLKIGPMLRKLADDFREFNRMAEPGWVFQAPEFEIAIIRLASAAPPAVSLSDAARKGMKEAKAEAGQEAEPTPQIALA